MRYINWLLTYFLAYFGVHCTLHIGYIGFYSAKLRILCRQFYHIFDGKYSMCVSPKNYAGSLKLSFSEVD